VANTAERIERVVGAGAVRSISKLVTYTDINTPAVTSVNVVIGQIHPTAEAVVPYAVLNVIELFSGSTDLTAAIGSGATPDLLLVDTNVMAVPNPVPTIVPQNPVPACNEVFLSGTDVIARFTSSVADLNLLTRGQVQVVVQFWIPADSVEAI